MPRPDSKRTPEAKLLAVHLRNTRKAKYQPTKIKETRK
jgi:hypothetical protein